MENDNEFKLKLNRILYEKAHMHVISSREIIYLNNTGLLSYNGRTPYADIYYFCSKMIYEHNPEKVQVMFKYQGKYLTTRLYVYIKDLTNALFDIRQRFFINHHTYNMIEDSMDDSMCNIFTVSYHERDNL